MTHPRIAMRWTRRPARFAAAASLGLLVLACDTTVVDPDIATPDNLSGESALPTIRASALGDFSLAYTGSGADGSSGTEGMVTASGLLADEFVNSETFPTRIEVDRRSIQVTNGTVSGWFRTVSRARRSTEFAATRYRQLATDTTKESGFAEMLSLAGYSYLLLAENWCSGVPISTANDDGSLTFGPPLTTQNLLDSAVTRFTQALAAANALTVSASTKALMVNLATVGLARARLDKAATSADLQAAATGGLAAVPTSFAYLIGHSENSTRQNNGVYVANVIAERYSVANGEGTNGLAYRALADPRVPFQRTPSNDVGFDGSTPQYDNLRYLDRKTSITLATGAEARLIEAEAALAAGNTASFVTIDSTLRAAPPGYFPMGSGTLGTISQATFAGQTAQQMQDFQFQERAFWLWLTGHRLGDLRRLSRTPGPYQRGTETVFPTGAYFKGGVYGPDVNFPVPFDETNNPNFTQCLDRNP